MGDDPPTFEFIIYWDAPYIRGKTVSFDILKWQTHVTMERASLRKNYEQHERGSVILWRRTATEDNHSSNNNLQHI